MSVYKFYRVGVKMATYKVIGDSLVCGKAKGEILSADDLVGININHLIETEHIEPETKKMKEEK